MKIINKALLLAKHLNATKCKEQSEQSKKDNDIIFDEALSELHSNGRMSYSHTFFCWQEEARGIKCEQLCNFCEFIS